MKLFTFKKHLLYILLGFGSLLATSCDDDNEDLLQPDDVQTVYENGVYVVNEGQFTATNAEISFISRDGKTVAPALFSQVNGRPLGDAAQSMTVIGDKAYIAVNNSEKIEVVDARTLTSTGVITGLKIPRYIAALNSNKAYVTEYFAYGENGRVSVLDLTNNTVTNTIEVGQLPEELVIYNGKLYVANSSGNTISVINTTTDGVETEINVGDAPNRILLDANNMLWVLRGGYGTSGALVKIDPTDNSIISYNFPDPTEGSGLLAINGAKNTLYYSYNGLIYSMSITDTTLPTTALIRRSPYGLGVDPQDNTIYVGLGGYTTNGWAIRYQTTGAVIDSFQVRVLPNGFTFR